MFRFWLKFAPYDNHPLPYKNIHIRTNIHIYIHKYTRSSQENTPPNTNTD